MPRSSNNLATPQSISPIDMNNLKNKPKIKRSVWLPSLLLIYLFAMTAWFAPGLIANGEIFRLVTVFVAEALIILLLHLFLKKRESKES